MSIKSSVGKSSNLIVGNARNKFRDGFSKASGVQPDTTVWNVSNTNNEHLIVAGGNSAGSGYLNISLSPLSESTEVTLTSKKNFTFPFRFGYGISISQRILGQEVFVGLVGTKDDNIDVIMPDADKPITGPNIVISSNVGTVTLANHGFTGGDRVAVIGCAEKRLNVGPVVVTLVDKNTFTIPITLSSGSYSAAGGVVRHSDPTKWANNAIGFLYENTSATNASFVSRRNGQKYRTLNSTVATTVATQSNTSPYTDAFNTASVNEIYASLDEISWRSYAADGVALPTGIGKYVQGIPDEEKEYKIHVRVRTLGGMTRPIAKIVSIAKAASTTATVTTDVEHGLIPGDQIQIYGVRDQTNFPNLTAMTAVASTPTTTTFTIVIGSSSTTTSYGGSVILTQGSALMPGVYAQVIQSIVRTNNVLTVVGSGTWATPLPGEYVQLYGLETAAAAYEGAYKVLRVNTTSLELESAGADFLSITTGGSVFKRTDVRLHFCRIMDYTRHVTEIVGGRGVVDANNSVPVYVGGGAVTISGSVAPTTGVSTTIWNAAGWGGFLVNDIVSAAITTSANTAAVTPGAVANIGTYAHSFHIAVTAVTGTTPTMDVQIQESPDGGTNWVPIYDFPRITAVGSYQSPLIRATWGTRYRYVQTIGGGTPSFTRSLNRLQFSCNPPLIRQFVDRSIVLTTLNSYSPVYFVDGIDTAQMIINVGAITTTAPQLQLEGSEDGTSFYSIGAPLTAVASSTVVLSYSNIMPKFIRVRVSTAGVGVTAGFLAIKGIGR